MKTRVANYFWAVKMGTLELKDKKEALKRDAVYTQIIQKHRLMTCGSTRKENNAAFLKIMIARQIVTFLGKCNLTYKLCNQ